MNNNQKNKRTRTARVGWGILLAVSGLLIFAGIYWFFDLHNLALANIAERTSLAPSEFSQGNPSAFDVIILITRQYAIGYAALGLMALLVAMKGYSYGSQWAWRVMWVLVGTIVAIAVNFTLVGGGGAGGFSYLAVAIVALVGQLLVLRGQAR